MEIKKLAKKYHGDMANTYDSLREGTPQWESEQSIVETLISGFGSGTRVLDIPVGTGRFLSAYSKFNFAVTGIDISTTMLKKAGEKVELDRLKNITLLEGDITSLQFEDNEFDLTVCIRFMDWVSTPFLERALGELKRVSSDHIVVYVITYTPFLELRPFSPTGLFRLLRQWKLKFYKYRTESESISHDNGKVQEIFKRLNLRVGRRFCIDKTDPSDRYWQSGLSRDIYVLRQMQ